MVLDREFMERKQRWFYSLSIFWFLLWLFLSFMLILSFHEDKAFGLPWNEVRLQKTFCKWTEVAFSGSLREYLCCRWRKICWKDYIYRLSSVCARCEFRRNSSVTKNSISVQQRRHFFQMVFLCSVFHHHPFHLLPPEHLMLSQIWISTRILFVCRVGWILQLVCLSLICFVFY